MSRMLAWAVEEACLNAWPCPRQVLRGRWLIRAAGGPSRRLNAVFPLPAHRSDPAGVEEEAGRLYAGLGQPLLFRVPALAEGLAAALEARGYRPQGETRTLFRPLDADIEAPEAGPALDCAATPSEDWLALRFALSGRDPAADLALRGAVGALLLPRSFVGVRVGGTMVAGAFGAIDRGVVVVEAVGTLPQARGRGHARRVVGALLAWARREGASGAALQVAADNAAARALYARLGFTTDLYPYSYYGPG